MFSEVSNPRASIYEACAYFRFSLSNLSNPILCKIFKHIEIKNNDSSYLKQVLNGREVCREWNSVISNRVLPSLFINTCIHNNIRNAIPPQSIQYIPEGGKSPLKPILVTGGEDKSIFVLYEGNLICLWNLLEGKVIKKFEINSATTPTEMVYKNGVLIIRCAGNITAYDINIQQMVIRNFALEHIGRIIYHNSSKALDKVAINKDQFFFIEHYPRNIALFKGESKVKEIIFNGPGSCNKSNLTIRNNKVIAFYKGSTNRPYELKKVMYDLRTKKCTESKDYSDFVQFESEVTGHSPAKMKDYRYSTTSYGDTGLGPMTHTPSYYVNVPSSWKNTVTVYSNEKEEPQKYNINVPADRPIKIKKFKNFGNYIFTSEVQHEHFFFKMSQNVIWIKKGNDLECLLEVKNIPSETSVMIKGMYISLKDKSIKVLDYTGSPFRHPIKTNLLESISRVFGKGL